MCPRDLIVALQRQIKGVHLIDDLRVHEPDTDEEQNKGHSEKAIVNIRSLLLDAESNEESNENAHQRKAEENRCRDLRDLNDEGLERRGDSVSLTTNAFLGIRSVMPCVT